MMMNSNRTASKFALTAPFAILLVSAFWASFTGCGPAESVYHDGNFSAEQQAAAQAEYQTVEDEESQGSNKKKKKTTAKR